MSDWNKLDMGLLVVNNEKLSSGVVLWDRNSGNAIRVRDVKMSLGNSHEGRDRVDLSVPLKSEDILTVSSWDEALDVVEKGTRGFLPKEEISWTEFSDAVDNVTNVTRLSQLKKKVEERIYDLQKGTI